MKETNFDDDNVNDDEGYHGNKNDDSTNINGHVALSCTQATLMQMIYNTTITIAYNRPRAYLAQESPPPLLEEQLQRDMFLVYY